MRTVAHENRTAHVEIERVAKLVGFGGAGGLDAGGQIPGVVSSETRPAEGAQQVLESSITEKVQGLVRKLELDLAVLKPAAPPLSGPRWGRLYTDVALTLHPPDEILDKFGDFGAIEIITVGILLQALEHLVREHRAL